MEKTITTKHELLEVLVKFNKELLDHSGDALNDNGFKSWMRTSSVKEDEVHLRTWWYPQEITSPAPHIINIETSIIYDAFAYNCDEEKYYTLVSIQHSLPCSEEMQNYFMLLYASSSLTNWSTRFDIMVYSLKEELGVPLEIRHPLIMTYERSGIENMDPNDFFDSI